MKIDKMKFNKIPVQLKASFFFFLCAFLQKGIAKLTTPIFTRLLTTAEYGQYSVFNSWLGIITIFVSLNLSAGVYTQGLVKFDKDKRIFASSIQGLTMVLCMAWLLIYIAFHEFWNSLFKLTTIQMISMMIIIWTTAVFSLWSSDQRVEYKYKALFIITLIVSVAKPVIGVICVIHSNDKVTAIILSTVLVELIGFSWLSVLQLKKGKKFFDGYYWKYVIIFNLPLIPHYLSQIVLNSADRIMISNMIGDSEAGIYSLAYSISSIMTLVNTALLNTLNPWIYNKIKEKKIKDISVIAYISLIVVAIGNIMVILFAPELVAIFAPKSYYEAVIVIPPVAMGVYFMFCYDLFAKFAFYYEKTFYIMIASILGAILNVGLNYICLNKFGYIAAGYTTLVCYIIYSLAHYTLMDKICNNYCEGVKPYNSKRILLISAVFVITGFLLLCTYKMAIIRYTIFLFLCVILFIKRKQILIQYRKLLRIKSDSNIT